MKPASNRRLPLDLAGTTFVLGKGGTGKSVLSAGLAALAADEGQRTLLVRIGESIRSEAPRSETPTSSKRDLDVVDLDPRLAMDEYVQKVVRLRPLVERITGSEVYRKFFAAAPGLPELVLLGRIRAYSHEMDARGRHRWDTIVVDCPSSGHGLLMLETPFAAFRAVPVGPFATLASEIIEWLKTEVRIAVVAIPEEMAVVEATEFKDDLLDRTGLRPEIVFLNRMRQETVSKAAHAALTELDPSASSSDLVLAEAANRVVRRTRLETFHLRRLAKGMGLVPVVVSEILNCRPAAMARELLGGRE